MNKCCVASIFLIVTLLLGCGSTPPNKATTIKPQQDRTPKKRSLNVEKQLRKIQALAPFQQANELLTFANALAENQQYDDCLRLLLTGYPHSLNLKPAYREQALICWHAIDPESSTDTLFDYNANTKHSGLSLINANKAWNEAQYNRAALLYFHSPLSTEQKIAKIWASIQQIETGKLSLLQQQHPELTPWTTLATWARKYNDKPEAWEVKLSQWQNRFGQQQLPVEFITETSQKIVVEINERPSDGINDNNIYAVLLPLTGDYAQHGKAIQDGILTRYFEQLEQNISFDFVDTEGLTTEQVVDRANQASVVIGPLRKTHVSDIIPKINTAIPVLALNRHGSEATMTNHSQHFYFAMQVEDEARQLADIIKANNHSKPLVVASGGAVSGRMLTAFNQQWSALHQESELVHKANVIRYDDSKSMRRNLGMALDIEQSKKRVRHIESVIPGKVHSITRNRQDIDAIILLANAQDTELLRPIIEASVSPFSASIPVYAGSRSTSSQVSKNSLRDLRNLRYLDLPWFIQRQQYKSLWTMSRTLWPTRRDGLLRLFAFGYDALSLTDNMIHLRKYPAHTEQFLTGELSIRVNGIITRKLDMGIVTKNGVVPFALDR